MKNLLGCLSLLCVVGCASPKDARMDFNDLNHFRTDCDHKAEQMAFLKKQEDNTPFWDRKSMAVIHYYQRFMNASCPDPEPAWPNGCIVVREVFGPGNSRAYVCRDEHVKGTVINRWQTEIDN